VFRGPDGTRTTRRYANDLFVTPANRRYFTLLNASFTRPPILLPSFALLDIKSRPAQTNTTDQLASLTKGDWPLDSYIFDMQWHRAPSWGGYEWDNQRYDDVTAMLASMHGMGLFTGMNLHDVSRYPGSDPSGTAGVVAVDNPRRWPAFAAAMGVDPQTQSVDFDIGNRTYAVALHEILVEPLLQQGLDMCWYDRLASHVTRHASQFTGPIFNKVFEACSPFQACCRQPCSTTTAFTTAPQHRAFGAPSILDTAVEVITVTRVLSAATCSRAGSRCSS